MTDKILVTNKDIQIVNNNPHPISSFLADKIYEIVNETNKYPCMIMLPYDGYRAIIGECRGFDGPCQYHMKDFRIYYTIMGVKIERGPEAMLFMESDDLDGWPNTWMRIELPEVER